MKAVRCFLAILLVHQWIEARAQEQSVSIGLSLSTVPTMRTAALSTTEGGSAKVCFNPSSRPSRASVISVKTKDGSARAGEDYTALDTELTYTEQEEQCVWFYPVLDLRSEGDETFSLEATGQSGDYTSDIVIKVTVTIKNQAMQGPSISIEHDTYPAVERDGSVSVCVVYYGASLLASDATVILRTDESNFNPVAPGVSKASDTSDYTRNSTKLTFVANSRSGTRMCLEITIKTDNIAESDELLEVVAVLDSGTISIAPLTSATVKITETQTVSPQVSIATGGAGGVGNSGRPLTSSVLPSLLSLLLLLICTHLTIV